MICEDGTWKAVFDAQCDQYYTFSVEMEGEPAGVAVLFRGTTDLGEQGGGVYEWIGRVNDEEFVGFFGGFGGQSMIHKQMFNSSEG